MKKQALNLYDDLISLTCYFNSNGCGNSGCQNISMTDFFALRLIHRYQPCPIQTLGHCLGITKSGATRVAKRLEQQALIMISPSPTDGRVRCLSLSDAGNDCMNKVISSQTTRLQQQLDSLGKEKSRQLISGLDALMSVLTP